MGGLARNQRYIAELLLARGRLHAYEIKRTLEEIVPHGSIYGAISSLERKGLITSEWVPMEEHGYPSPPRKYVELTAHGRAVLQAEADRDQAAGRIRAEQRRRATGDAG